MPGPVDGVKVVELGYDWDAIAALKASRAIA